MLNPNEDELYTDSGRVEQFLRRARLKVIRSVGGTARAVVGDEGRDVPHLLKSYVRQPINGVVVYVFMGHCGTTCRLRQCRSDAMYAVVRRTNMCICQP